MGVRARNHYGLADSFSQFFGVFSAEIEQVASEHYQFVLAVVQVNAGGINGVVYALVKAPALGIAVERLPFFGRNIDQRSTCF
jgi:hypothetical protein